MQSWYFRKGEQISFLALVPIKNKKDLDFKALEENII